MKLIILSTVFTSVAALKSNSSAGQKLLSKSRALEENYNSWIVDYSLKFDSCHTVVNFNAEDANGDEGAVSKQKLAKFKLCPSDKCGSYCTGAEYLVDMDQFVNSYTEWQMNDKEYKCEQVRENCNCDYYDDEEACENKCYTTAGLYDDCVEVEQGDDDSYVFDLQEWMECSQIEYENDDGTVYYVGPKCSSNGQRINLGVFSDEFCTEAANDEMFYKTYGVELPYTSSSIVSEACLSCKVEDANNDGYYQDPEITEICEESYDMAAKCESNLASSLSYPITTGCSYINRLSAYAEGSKSVGGGAATGWAIFFGLSTLAMAGVAGKLYMDTKVRRVDLATDAAVV
mmetsp:Transcript_13097/g.19087  ORF Transcript_13097/g.19087 Transcript_13097/m.19087 type:complete len:345 (-) Transcript_13097:156-1190(-)|eukprot:CAMPEP_0197233592 /NCGR_PEP_ID=MMETSP1429-20130617/1602_1 /TAXON_ID=49237 /ORGANISM="Chaetoceros  sp., Strain UNC1202" /LENGTH=344 /DNA_ID=CAMNT_0042691857 /DNA_START=38 /DNA_END=1072 /DNA_ORIENTATION=-